MSNFAQIPVEFSLAVKFPEIASQWNYYKNGNLKPTELSYGSTKKIWWICSKGHEWQVSINARTNRTRGCPYCTGFKVSDNNLELKAPEIALEWHPTKNGDLTSNLVAVTTHKKVWWICENNHDWEATVANRTNKKSGCPYCSGRKATKENNIVALYPKLMEEWDHEKNEGLMPEQITPQSHLSVHWKCQKGHSWSARVYNRTGNESDCPLCCNIHTNLEKLVEEKLGIEKFNKKVLENARYQPDFQLSNDLFLNVDGLYWHSEEQKGKDYHFKMREAYVLENKRILQFYEDEVQSKWSIVESIINNSLGKITNKLDARKCQLKLVNDSQANIFYSSNHLMGSCSFATHYGLWYNQELISLISIRKHEDNLEIIRFCTKINTNIRGGFQKLLSYIVLLYYPKQVISFCDLRYATGKSYIKAGFRLNNISQGWQWIDHINRYNRLYCIASNGKTEKENAQEKGLTRIYDAGQAKYILELE